ncbi:MAG: dTMP kinase [Gammaproteobacteria bacterium]|nr:MAG: dTMP kinase [Gammaproteobacteria bacterium]
MTGKFITLEGIEGVGKSTNTDFVADLVKAAGHDVVVTREPGGTPLAERLREIALHHDDEPVPALAELLIMFAARSLHLDNLIKPAIVRGEWVVCDRFTDATYAYQGGGRGQDVERISALEGWVQTGIQPDLTILLDADPEIGMSRAAQRSAADRFERERQEFFQRVRLAYLARADKYKSRFRVIDAAQPLDKVQENIRTVLNKEL